MRAVAHLIGLGHRRIGIVSDTPEITSSAERIAGYRRALRGGRDRVGPEPGLDRRLDPGRRRGGGAAAARSPRRPTAVFTANNFMTVGALRAARALGLRIPADVALVGFDDLDWTTLVEPPLTVVTQPVAELGRAAGERLLAGAWAATRPPRRMRLDAS